MQKQLTFAKFGLTHLEEKEEQRKERQQRQVDPWPVSQYIFKPLFRQSRNLPMAPKK